jgi:hypothetical protein
VQNRFGVLHQGDAALVDECAAAGIAFMPPCFLTCHKSPTEQHRPALPGLIPLPAARSRRPRDWGRLPTAGGE